MNKSDWLSVHKLPDDEKVNIHRCPSCMGVFGIDASFNDQAWGVIVCPMCAFEVRLNKKMKIS